MTTVLIVDDKEEALRYLETLLNKHNFSVVSARNGAEALAAARQHALDLVISDLLMPIMDGYTLLWHWKTDAQLKAIPFIVYTATFTDLDDRHFGENLGADAYLLKPARIATFMDCVRQVLARASVAEPVSLPAAAPLDDDSTTLKYYSERLIRKLEEKTVELERANRALQREISDHQRAEEELRFNVTILQTQQQASLDAILVVSGDGRVLSYNAQLLKLWGMSVELLESCREVPLQRSATIMTEIGKALEDPAAYLAKIQYLHEHPLETSLDEVRFNNGTIVEVYSAPATGTDGQHYGRIWYYRDVTENRLAKASLEASVREQRQLTAMLEVEHARLTAAQQIARVGSWETDLATMNVIWSQEVHRIFETDPATFAPTHDAFLALVHPDDRARVHQAFIDSTRERATNKVQHRLLLRDGKVKFVEENWRVYTDEHGQPLRALGTCLDITEQKAAEEQIHGLGKRLIDTLESIPDGFFTIDGNWNFSYVNGRAEKLLLRTRGELLGRNIWDEFKEAAPSQIRRNYERVVAEQTSIAFEEFYPPLNAWFEITAYPARDGLAVYFRDVTKRKETEAQLAYLRRVRAVLSGINALIVRATSREQLFTEACRIAYEAGAFRMVMLCILNPATQKLEPVASQGKDEALMDVIRSTLASAETASQTMVMRAMETQQPVVANDSVRDERVLFGERYRASGVQSMAVLPLIVHGRSIGVLVLYARESGFFLKDEMSLLTELANDIAFAVDHIEKQERLDYLANFDTLTGLANRTLFLERLRQRLPAATSAGRRLCVALINIARFKNINDTLGRASGDVLLQLLAEYLIRHMGNAHSLARIGADEFAAVFEIRPQGNLIKLFDHLHRILEDNSFAVNDTTLRIAARSGIAIFPDDGADADTVLRNAEAALKGARVGNERFKFYTSDMNVAVASRLAMEIQLRRAVGNNEFELYYQPKASLLTGKLTGAEALIRWNDSQGNLVLPGQFIPVLEETGMIADVGHWALRKAIEHHTRWHRNGLPAVRIAVNVSPLQLNSRNFIRDLQHDSGLDSVAAAGLELEITEGVIMNDIVASTASLKAIRAMGITVAIDDFGTGFSSLAYLARLPVDSLKIDRSFVVDMTAGPEGLALVSTIIGLAHSLNLKVVAEGVETEEQLRLLRLLKCDEIQGYILSRPLPLAEFEGKFLAHDFKLAF